MCLSTCVVHGKSIYNPQPNKGRYVIPAYRRVSVQLIVLFAMNTWRGSFEPSVNAHLDT